MLKKEEKLIITYHTSNMAFATEKVCKDKGIKGELISAPRALSADCGISYATGVENRAVIEEIFKECNIEYEKMVNLEV